MSATETIAEYTRAIADLLNAETGQMLERLREAEMEAMARIGNIAPVEYDYDGAAAYLRIPRRTLERRVSAHAITYRKDGQRVFFTKSALDQYMAGLVTKRRELRPLPC